MKKRYTKKTPWAKTRYAIAVLEADYIFTRSYFLRDRLKVSPERSTDEPLGKIVQPNGNTFFKMPFNAPKYSRLLLVDGSHAGQRLLVLDGRECVDLFVSGNKHYMQRYLVHRIVWDGKTYLVGAVDIDKLPPIAIFRQIIETDFQPIQDNNTTTDPRKNS